MDKKHKKKHTAHNKQKVVNAQHRNEYLYKFRRLVDRLTGDPAIFRMIPDKMYPILAIVRARSVRIFAAPGHDISPKIM